MRHNKNIEFCWLQDFENLKLGLKETLGASGQLMKRHFSSKELSRPIFAQSVVSLPIEFLNHGKINPEYVGPEASILREESQFVALHKPAGIHCHPLVYDDKDTILNYLISVNAWSALKVNEEHYDRGLLYRLDQETSGVLVLAKTQEYFEKIRSNFQTAMKRKFYWAVVKGTFDKEGIHQHYFRGTGVKGHKQKVSEDYHSEADQGTLNVLKVMEQGGYSLVLVNLKTGLRHQIRAQLAHLGFPILGDELYGGEKSERLFLHALRYEFDETVEDPKADLFHLFFDLDRALQVSHDMFRRF